MAVSTAAKVATSDEAMRKVAAAMASEDGAEGGPLAEAGASDPMEWLSRMTYSGSYALAYGLVYAVVFVAQSLPQENAMMRGLRDGGREAAEQLSDG